MSEPALAGAPRDGDTRGTGPARVVVADDQAIVRAGIVMLLQAEADLHVVGEAADGAEVVDLAVRERPDVVVMDLHMPRVDGAEATRRICDLLGGAVRVLALTTFDEDEMVYGALRAGASGFLLKHSAPATLVAAIRHIASGGVWIDPQVAPAVVRGLVAAGAAGGPPSGDGAVGLGDDAQAVRALASLTDREREVLALMAHGLTNAQIAAHFVLSESTVKTHVARILVKTDSHDRARAVVLAFRAGLVGPHDPLPLI